jgi:NADH-quinone oxidoreductase subunit M
MLAIAILTPLCVGLVILFLKEERADAKFQSRNALAAIATTLAVFAVAVAAQTRFAGNYGEAQLKEVWYTFTGAGLNLVFALDGLSMPLFLSTAFLFLIAALFSLNLQKLQTGAGSAPVLTRQFWASLLFLESIVLGVFAAYNFIVFFMLWELFLIPVVVLMWRFGLEERKAAAARFFIYTFVSSAFMLAAFAALVYYTPRVGADFDFKTTFASELQLVHFEKQRLIFLFFIIAFLVKMPVFPFHAWLPLTPHPGAFGDSFAFRAFSEIRVLRRSAFYYSKLQRRYRRVGVDLHFAWNILDALWRLCCLPPAVVSLRYCLFVALAYGPVIRWHPDKQ